MAVVVSEDGGIDVIPDRRPPIKRSDIEDRVSELRALPDAERVNQRRYRQLTDWFRERRFYLLQEHCDAINRVVTLIDRRIEEQEPDATHFIQGQFASDPAMDEALYYESEE